MSVTISPPMLFQFSVGGVPALGYQLFTYISNTSTKQATWTDSTQTIQNPNPLRLDANGCASVWADPTLTYTYLLTYPNDTDPPSTSVYSQSGIQASLTLGSLTQSVIGGILFAQTTAERNAALTPANEAYSASPFYDMNRYGVQSDGVDNTAIVQTVYNMAKVSGGTLVFPPGGDFAFYLDVSGSSNANVIIDGQGSNFRCYLPTPAQSAVVFGNNGTATVTQAGNNVACSTFTGTNIEFRNMNFYAKRYSGGASTGDLYTAVALYGCNAKFWNCSFYYGKTASFYGCYAQYTEFWSCGFYLATYSTTSCGCLLDSHTTAASSNEVAFMRCYFQVNANALWLKGCFLTRLYGCNFQGNGAVTGGGSGSGALVIDQDTTGLGCVSTKVDGAWFEVNTVPSVQVNLAADTLLQNNLFLSSSGAITFNNCYGVMLIGNATYGGITVNFTHSTADTAQITMRGNDSAIVIGTWNISSATTKILDLHIQGSYTGTLTGCTTSPTATVHYTVEGDAVDIHLPVLTGTSDTTACTITGAPTFIIPATGWYAAAYLQDNSAGFAGNVYFDTSGVLNFIKANSENGFTNTGTKGSLQNVVSVPLFV